VRVSGLLGGQRRKLSLTQLILQEPLLPPAKSPRQVGVLLTCKRLAPTRRPGGGAVTDDETRQGSGLGQTGAVESQSIMFRARRSTHSSLSL
jgi:hypothetical protein